MCFLVLTILLDKHGKLSCIVLHALHVFYRNTVFASIMILLRNVTLRKNTSLHVILKNTLLLVLSIFLTLHKFI